MNAARLVSRDLRVVRAQTRHIADLSENVCTLITRFVDSTSSRAIAFFRDSRFSIDFDNIVPANRIFPSQFRRDSSKWPIHCRHRLIVDLALNSDRYHLTRLRLKNKDLVIRCAMTDVG